MQQYYITYNDAYANYCNEIIDALWNQSVCVGNMSLSEYQEEMYEYLEEEKFTVIDDYAGVMFDQELSFQSALLKIHTDEENWLVSVGLNLDSNNPAFNQEVNNDLYWPVLSENWDIELRNPEPEINEVSGYSKIGNKGWKLFGDWSDELVKSGPYVRPERGNDFRGILLFIFNNWDSIEKILIWLGQNITYDCHPSTASSVSNDYRIVPSSMSPERSRRIYYHVRQKGVLADFKATETKIEGKVKLLKKKKNGSRYIKDKNNLCGIGYCTLQWNACDGIPWPADNIPHEYAGAHGHKKTKFKHYHPYALTIYNSGDFLTYYLYYNQQFTGELVYALGGNISCT